ncbi:hypothetical protein [Streptomyces sp. NPDC012825]
MSWMDRLFGALTGVEPEPECPPDCVKCAESASIDPDYVPEEER